MPSTPVLRYLDEEQPTHAQLLALLQEGDALTQTEMTERLPISSKRQARRLVKKLEQAGVPIETHQRGREKEYGLPPGEWMSGAPLDLTERQALALLLAAGAAESGLGPAPLTKALKGATQRLVDGLQRSIITFEPGSLMSQLHFGEAASVQVNPEVFMELIGALSNRRTIEIDYYSASSDTSYEGRAIDPWGLAVRGDAWLCVANDHRSGERRDFNLTRIEAVRPRFAESNGGDYRIPDEFDLELHFVDRFESLAADQVYEAHLLVDADAVPYFRSKSYHRTQQIHEDKGDGDQIVVSYEVAGLEEIAAFVRSWGTSVTVLQPSELSTRIAAEAREVANQYDAGRATG